MPVPLFATSLDAHQDAIARRLAEVAASGRCILGPEVEAFEREFAEFLGVRALRRRRQRHRRAHDRPPRARGVGPGDEVVVPSFTFYATAEAVVNAGARPVFCDIDPATFCVTRDTVAAAVTPRTRAIVPVHLFGNVAPIDDLQGAGAAGPRGRGAGRRGAARRSQGGVARRRRHVLASSRRRTSGASATAGRS